MLLLFGYFELRLCSIHAQELNLESLKDYVNLGRSPVRTMDLFVNFRSKRYSPSEDFSKALASIQRGVSVDLDREARFTRVEDRSLLNGNVVSLVYVDRAYDQQKNLVQDDRLIIDPLEQYSTFGSLTQYVQHMDSVYFTGTDLLQRETERTSRLEIPEEELAYDKVQEVIRGKKTFAEYIEPYLREQSERKTFYAYAGNDPIEETSYKNGELEMKTVYERVDGNKVETVYLYLYGGGEKQRYKVRTYDANGKILREATSPDTDDSTYTLYSYNSGDKLVRKTRYDGNGYVEEYTAYDYNEHGQQISNVDYNQDGVLVSRSVFRYHPNGELFEKAGCDGFNTPSLLYRYDEAGRYTLQRSYVEGEILEEFTYIYDEVGRLVEAVDYQRRKVAGITTPSTKRVTFSYSTRGNLATRTIYDADEQISHVECEYSDFDSYENWQKSTCVFSATRDTLPEELKILSVLELPQNLEIILTTTRAFTYY